MRIALFATPCLAAVTFMEGTNAVELEKKSKFAAIMASLNAGNNLGDEKSKLATAKKAREMCKKKCADNQMCVHECAKDYHQGSAAYYDAKHEDTGLPVGNFSVDGIP